MIGLGVTRREMTVVEAPSPARKLANGGLIPGQTQESLEARLKGTRQ